MRPTLTVLTAFVVLAAVPAATHASGGGDSRDCGRLDDTRSVSVIAYGVSCAKASEVVKLAVRNDVGSAKARTVSGTHLGFSCRGAASRNRISVSCRRGGGAQYLTARGRT